MDSVNTYIIFLHQGGMVMNFEIFMGLIGVPLGIILTAFICYGMQVKKDQDKSTDVDQQRGISQ